MTIHHLHPAWSPALALGLGAPARVLAVDPAGRYWRLHPDGTRRPVHDPGQLMAGWWDDGHPYSIRHVDWPTLYALPDTGDHTTDQEHTTAARSA